MEIRYQSAHQAEKTQEWFRISQSNKKRAALVYNTTRCMLRICVQFCHVKKNKKKKFLHVKKAYFKLNSAAPPLHLPPTSVLLPVVLYHKDATLERKQCGRKRAGGKTRIRLFSIDLKVVWLGKNNSSIIGEEE